MQTISYRGSKYYITFIDDSSRWCEINFLKQKSQAVDEFENYINYVETQQGKKVKCFQTDNGKEYDNIKFDNLLKQHGISRRLTAPYNPEQNGVSERKNRTLMDTARCLLIQSGLPSTFWAEAVSTANFIRNRSPSRKLNRKTPYECWFGEPPDVTDFKPFGCEVFVTNRTPDRGKLEPRSREGIFIGYSSTSKAYRIWLPEEKKTITSRDVKFLNQTTDRPT